MIQPMRSHPSTALHTLGFLILLFAASPGFALTTLTVTISTDNNPGGIGEVGDLRYALNAMNQDLNVVPDDYAIVFTSPMTIQLNGILPIVNNSPNPVNVTIGNPDTASIVTLDGNNGAYRGLFIPIGNVTIRNMGFQNLTAQGGNGGNGMSGGGGGMGAGGAIYAPQTFLNGSNPSITLMNVWVRNSAAVGGNGGSYQGSSSTGNEGGGGGGGFSGHGGSVTASGSTGGGGGGGFGGNGGDATLSMDDVLGGGGGGGGGLGSRATIGTLTNLGDGGIDQAFGRDGNGFGLAITAGSGAGGLIGGNNAGGGGGGAGNGMSLFSGGGGGGSAGGDGLLPQGNIPARAAPSGGFGGDGAGGGGGGVVIVSPTNEVDGQAGFGGYGGGGGGGAGTGGYDIDYALRGGMGGLGGGGGGGGTNQSGITGAEGGDSLGGGGGAGAGASNGPTALGGVDIGNLGGGSGGVGANTYGMGFGGGGGGGGSGLGGAIFVDSNLNFTLQALPGVPTTFETTNNTTQAGTRGTGGPGGADGTDGSAFGNSIFLRTGATLTLLAQDAADVLTLSSQVAFTDDTVFGAGGTQVHVQGNGAVVYLGTTDYQGSVVVRNANFKVHGQILGAPVFVDQNSGFSPQKGTLSGTGTLTGDVFVASGTVAPDVGATLTLGNLQLGAPAAGVRVAIDAASASKVAVVGTASLSGQLEIQLDPAANRTGTYTVLTAGSIVGSFDSVTVTGATPASYSVSYLPAGAPTSVELKIVGPTGAPPPIQPIPTLDRWGLIMLSGLIGVAWMRLRRAGGGRQA